MTSKVNGASVISKAVYARPQLAVFGSVRNLTGGSNGTLGDGMVMQATVGMSDPRTKENVVQIGTHEAGFGIYLFDYKAEFQAEFGAGRQFGVMADEVAAIVPEAIVLDDNGFARVDYAKLGITRH